MGRVAKWKRDKEEAKERLHKLRTKVLGEYWKVPTAEDVFMKPLPEPHGAQERFLTICQIGGVVPFLAAHYGLRAEPLEIRNVWLIEREMDDGRHEHIHLWMRPRRHDARPDAEVFDGWSSGRTPMTRLRAHRRRNVLYSGDLESCLDTVRSFFARREAVRRLGGDHEGIRMVY